MFKKLITIFLLNPLLLQAINHLPRDIQLCLSRASRSHLLRINGHDIRCLSDTQVQELSNLVPKVHHLNKLYLDYMRFQDMSDIGFSVLLRGISNSSIRHLRLGQTDMVGLDITRLSALLNALGRIRSLESLDLTVGYLHILAQNREKWSIFNNFLRRSHIRRLNITRNSLERWSKDAMHTFAQTLIMMSSLEELNLSLNFFCSNEDCLNELAYVLPQMQSLKKFYLHLSEIDRLSFRSINLLFEQISLMPALEVLDLSYNNLQDMSTEQLDSIFRKLQSIRSLKRVDLAESDFTDRHSAVVTKAFIRVRKALLLLPHSVLINFKKLAPRFRKALEYHFTLCPDNSNHGLQHNSKEI